MQNRANHRKLVYSRKSDSLAVKWGNNELWKLFAIRTNQRLWRSIHITTMYTAKHLLVN